MSRVFKAPPPEETAYPPVSLVSFLTLQTQKQWSGDESQNKHSSGINLPISSHPIHHVAKSSGGNKWKLFDILKPKSGKPQHTERDSWIFYPALLLENHGSVARDHLASERTYLAYIRTSVSMASTGVILVQFFAIASFDQAVGQTLAQARHFARPLGASFVVFGLLVLVMGVRRYFVIQAALPKGFFPVTRLGAVTISISVAVLNLFIFIVLFSSRN